MNKVVPEKNIEQKSRKIFNPITKIHVNPIYVNRKKYNNRHQKEAENQRKEL